MGFNTGQRSLHSFLYNIGKVSQRSPHDLKLIRAPSLGSDFPGDAHVIGVGVAARQCPTFAAPHNNICRCGDSSYQMP